MLSTREYAWGYGLIALIGIGIPAGLILSHTAFGITALLALVTMSPVMAIIGFGASLYKSYKYGGRGWFLPVIFSATIATLILVNIFGIAGKADNWGEFTIQVLWYLAIVHVVAPLSSMVAGLLSLSKAKDNGMSFTIIGLLSLFLMTPTAMFYLHSFVSMM